MHLLFELFPPRRDRKASSTKKPALKTSGAGASAPAMLPASCEQIDVEALEFQVVPGSANRLGFVTDAGEAYLMDARSGELERVECGPPLDARAGDAPAPPIGPIQTEGEGTRAAGADSGSGLVGGARAGAGDAEPDARQKSLGADGGDDPGVDDAQESRYKKRRVSPGQPAPSSLGADGTGPDRRTDDDAAGHADVDAEDEDEPEVRLMGVGSDHIVLVRSDGVWVKGDSECAC
jgi:hypothetical protein